MGIPDIMGLLGTVVGVIVRSNSFSNPFSRQSWRFRRNLFLFDVADLLELKEEEKIV